MSQMFQQGRVGLIAILVVGTAIIAGLWYFKPEPDKRPPSTPQPPLVDITLAKPQDYQVSVLSQGTIVPKRQINLVAEVSGRVVDISSDFVSGGFFEADEVLVTLDDRDYRYALTNADAQVANSERELALEKGQARQAKRVWRDLGSVEANSLSLRKPQVNAAKAALKAAKAEQQRAALNIQRAAISAPFDGRVEGAQVNLGQYVPAGSILGSVFDSSVVEVRLPLNSRQFSLLGIIPGSNDASALVAIPVELSVDIGGKTHQWLAHLARVEASVDSRTRLFHVIAEVEQPFDTDIHEHPLVVGLFVQAKIGGRNVESAISIPKKAVMDQHVFVVDAENKVLRRKVTLIDSKGDTVWVKADISEGEKIVSSDPRVLTEGITIKTKSNQSTTSKSDKNINQPTVVGKE